MKASVFFADIWDRINLSDKKRLMGQVRMKYGNNYSQDDLYKLLAVTQFSFNSAKGVFIESTHLTAPVEVSMT
jgi:hypothetical protein